jgi:hypothetical protein
MSVMAVTPARKPLRSGVSSVTLIMTITWRSPNTPGIDRHVENPIGIGKSTAHDGHDDALQRFSKGVRYSALETRGGARGGNMGSTSATKSDADVKLEAVYLLPNISRNRRVRPPLCSSRQGASHRPERRSALGCTYSGSGQGLRDRGEEGRRWLPEHINLVLTQ